MSVKQNDENNNVPTLAKVWLSIYHAVPKMKLKGSSIDWGFTCACVIFFFVARLMLQEILHSFGWPIGSPVTKDAAGSLTGAIFHTPNLVTVSFVLMRSVKVYNPLAVASDHPVWWQDVADAIIQLCTGHMICDTIVGLILDRWIPGQGPKFDDEAWLFLTHHIISLLYLVSTRLLKAGQQSMLMCFLIGEVSNPTFCAYLVCQIAKTLDCCSGPKGMQVIRYIEILNSIIYIPCRAIIGPIIGTHMSYLIMKNKVSSIPIVIRILWTMIMWGIAIGSIPYIISFYKDLVGHLSEEVLIQEL
jgi:TLC domain